MLNVLNILNQTTGEIETPQWVAEALENLDRFGPMLDQVKKAAKILSQGVYESDSAELLTRHAFDFYEAWMASSSEVIQAAGLPVVIELFELFGKYSFIAWPVDSQIALEQFGPEDKIQVYRGESLSLASKGIAANISSWTCNRDTAESYKARHADGVLLEGTICKRNIFVFFIEESEIITFRENVRIDRIV